jgi:hypothetical protein
MKVSWELVSQKILEVVDPNVRDQSAQDLFKLYFYSYVSGNGDLHAKNVSVWTNPETNIVEVSPSYDLTSLVFYMATAQDVDRTMALPLNKRKNNFRAEDFLAYAQKIGLDEKVAKQIMVDISQTVDREIHNFQPPTIYAARLEQGKEIITERCAVFMDLAIEKVPPAPPMQSL